VSGSLEKWCWGIGKRHGSTCSGGHIFIISTSLNGIEHMCPQDKNCHLSFECRGNSRRKVSNIYAQRYKCTLGVPSFLLSLWAGDLVNPLWSMALYLPFSCALQCRNLVTCHSRLYFLVQKPVCLFAQGLHTHHLLLPSTLQTQEILLHPLNILEQNTATLTGLIPYTRPRNPQITRRAKAASKEGESTRSTCAR
jgi:hypothetical protein